MKKLLPAIAALALAAACHTAPPPRPVPASSLSDRAGDSLETAVSVPVDATSGGVPFENDWIFDRFGRFRRRGGGTGQAAGRRYDVVKIELPNGDTKTLYFDITDNWKRWSPQ